MARGRKRRSGERYPSGGLKRPNGRGDDFPYTPEQIRHRASALGIDPARLAGRRVSVDRICMDMTAGTALGRLTWIHRPDGSVARRVDDLGSGQMEAWITDEMVGAAEDYRVLWARWHRLERLPRRHPQARSFERRDHARADDLDPDDPSDERQVRAAAERLRACEQAIRQCPCWQLTRAMVESVVIENALPAAIALDAPGPALMALRAGLAALHAALHGDRRRRKVAA